MRPLKTALASPWLTIALLAIFCGIAFYTRVVLPYSQVFTGDWIKYTTNDAYYFMRQIDNLVHNFPHFLAFDPYQNFPQGTVLTGQNFFVFFVSSIVWLVGLGSPSQHTLDVVSAYLPAVLGALTVVPVFFIGRTLFNRWAGLFSAAMIAILPGEFLGRTILGNTDRDAFEVMLSALTMLFLILAVKTAREKGLTFGSLTVSNLKIYTLPIVFSILLGIVLGLFVLTWRGSFLFILVILVYFVLQSIIDHLKKRSSQYLGFTVITALLISLIIFFAGSRVGLVLAALAVSLLASVILSGLAWILAYRKVNPLYYPAAIVIVALVGAGLLYAASPSLFRDILNQFNAVLPGGVNSTVSQMRPILFPVDQFSIVAAWKNYTTAIFLIFVAFALLIYTGLKREEPDKVLFLVWSLIMLVATLLTRRIALFFALNVALLMGYLGWQIIAFASNKTSTLVNVTPQPANQPKTKKKQRSESPRVRRGFLARNRAAVLTVTSVAVILLIVFPQVSPALTVAAQAPYVPSDDWVRALSWLKDNTPEPLGNAAAYDSYYQKPVPYPSSAYGIASWWDFGYWIMRIGHRLPVSDPGGGARQQVAQLLTAQNEAGANQIMDQLQSRYVIIDDTTVGGKFYGVTTYASLDFAQFAEVYYSNNGGTLTPVVYYHPAFYQSLAVRLYEFDGKAVAPKSILVISYQDKVSREGIAYKQIASSNTFSKYQDATAFIAGQKNGNYQIVGTSSLQSPVPLESLQHYREVYPANQPGSSTVKIFEYSK